MNELQIDRTHWKKYRFDEVCRQVNEVTKDPQAEGLDHVIGLEHIEPNNLHITQWDTLEKETTFTRKFCKGQVLFGRRRAYQRKVAYAEFDGICSGDILVFEAIEDVLLPELLPFLIQSEGFFQKALATSAGSLSPRTKFKELADYEFLLPPKAEQKRLAELLWAADEVVEKEKRVECCISSFISRFIGNKYQALSKDCVTLGDLCISNPSYGANSPACDYDGTTRYVRITDIDNQGCLLDDEIKSTNNIDTDKYLLEDGDLLIARTATPGKSFLYDKQYGNCVYAGYLIRFKLNTSLVLPKFVFYYTLSSNYWQWINSTIKTGTVSNINAKEYSSLLIPFCSIEKQEEMVKELEEIFKIKKQLLIILNNSQQIKQELIDKIF